MVVANKEQIKITGVIYMELKAKDEKLKCYTAKEIVYVSICIVELDNWS